MPLTYPGKPRQPKDGLLSAEAMEDEGDAPRYPLMGAWMCQTFFPWTMPLLYGLAWAVLRARAPRRCRPNAQAARLIEMAMAPYSSSLYPVLALALERQHFMVDSEPPRPCFDLGLTATGGPWLCPQEHSLAGETTAARLRHLVGSDQAHRLAVVDPEALPFADESLGTYRMNNVIQRYLNRRGPLDEAFRVLKPGGIVQISDVTSGWVESMWPTWLAGRLGLQKLKRQLIRGKLQDTQEVLAPGPHWWAENLCTERWELLALRPFFSQPSLRLASLFESMNFKQGGPSPIWIEEKLRRHGWLARLYRGLIRGLAQLLMELDDQFTRACGGAFVMVTLRKRGQLPDSEAETPHWCCPACHRPLGPQLNCSCSTGYPAEGGIALLGADLCPC
ncbi:methyltransferase domain-containing protein [bacterium]|nr:methyltransferase domain-containing protein [bacterium]